MTPRRQAVGDGPPRIEAFGTARAEELRACEDAKSVRLVQTQILTDGDQPVT